MGIQGLHKSLAFATRKTTLRDFRGQRLAIDSSSWLHRSVYSVSEQYVEAMEAGRVDQRSVGASVKYITNRCKELLNVFEMSQVLLVMDGKRCPLKADTNCERERKRSQNLSKAREFRRRGDKSKAIEKYKCCIKIKDAFTFEVMKKVQDNFRLDSRVRFVYSPYEADAQLAKLCLDGDADAVITEDSDVLVYSAAAHCAFPIIFKLDRRSGTCDVISMDWFLDFRDSQSPTGNGNKKSTGIEALLLNFASRQSRRPGFGVRLFVQGCVLAGCDYAVNKLSGVGLVNAFKLVRDCAFRHDSIRFSKLLEALQGRNKVGIDEKEYELNLAKSEAVFFYHLVKHRDGTVRPLCEPKEFDTENDEDENLHSFTHHFPAMQRFDNDWTFLGESPDHEKLLPSERSGEPPVPEIVIKANDGSNQAKGKGATTIPQLFKKAQNPTRNPYAKRNQTNPTRKRPREETTGPLREIGSNSTSIQSASSSKNMFSAFARKSDQSEAFTTDQNASPNPLVNTSSTGTDYRFVKRSYEPGEMEKRVKTMSRWYKKTYTTEDAPRELEPQCYDHNQSSTMGHLQTVTPFDGQRSNRIIQSQLSGPQRALERVFRQPPQQEVPTFYDLTDVQSPVIGSIDDGFEDFGPARVSLDPSDVAANANVLPPHEAIDLCDEPEYNFQVPAQSPGRYFSSVQMPDPSTTKDMSFFGSAVQEDEFFEESHSSTSRYFGRSADGAGRQFSSPPLKMIHTGADSTGSSLITHNVDNDEVIDSPDIGGARRNPFQPMARHPQPKKSVGSQQNGIGKLQSMFARQRHLSSSQQSTGIKGWVRKVPKLGRQRPPSKRGSSIERQSNLITSFFNPSGRGSGIPQLEMNCNQTDEDFLWNSA